MSRAEMDEISTSRRGFLGMSISGAVAAMAGFGRQQAVRQVHPPMLGAGGYAMEMEKAARLSPRSSLDIARALGAKLESGEPPKWLLASLEERAIQAVAEGRAATPCPAPRGAPEWLRRRKHIEAETAFLVRLAKQRRRGWLDRLLSREFGDEDDRWSWQDSQYL